MQISLDWISQYVDIVDIPPKQIADRLTMSTAEVEDIHTLVRTLDGIVTASIVSLQPIGDEQTFVTVRCGDRTFKTVCTASNLRVGMLSCFAPRGATLANRQIVEEREFEGRRSEGVLCSSDELGMGGGHYGILDLPDIVSDGVAIRTLVPKSDTLLEIDNKSLTHRPDLWGHYGFAREIAAIFDRKLGALELADLSPYNNMPEYNLTVDDATGCPAYCCVEMSELAVRPSPMEIQYRLHALGQRTFNNLVDLTNYVMLEIGQPMHAFDGAKLGSVRVAPFGEKGTFTTLDGADRKMLPEDLMIWNASEPVALAGIMGGMNSEVTDNTVTLLLESANFRESRIRRTATRLGLHTDASQRFEKQQPPANTREGVRRYLHLLRQSGIRPSIRTRLSSKGDLKDQVRYLDISKSFFDTRIGNSIEPGRIVSILTSIGFTAGLKSNHFRVGIPPFRSEKDISLPIDILEEVTRINGYDNLEPIMPHFSAENVRFNDSLRSQHKARRVLAQAYGFSEIHSYSWFDETWLKSLAYDPGHTLEMANSSSEKNIRLQNTLVPNILWAVKKNTMVRDAFRLFELGKIYKPDTTHGRVEHHVLCGASYQQERAGSLEEHFRGVKGALEGLAEQLNLVSPIFTSTEAAKSPWAEIDSTVEISVAGVTIGALGFLTNPLLDKISPQGQIIWFELNFDHLQGPIFPVPIYTAPSRYPMSWFDFSIVENDNTKFSELEKKLEDFSHPLLRKKEFMTVFRGETLGADLISYTFRYWIGSSKGTLSGEQIDAFQGEYLDFIKSKGLQLR